MIALCFKAGGFFVPEISRTRSVFYGRFADGVCVLDPDRREL